MFGKFYTFFNVKYVFLVAIAIFEIGSAICGAAPNSIAFIIGRAVAGLGSAGIMSGVVSYTLLSFQQLSGFFLSGPTRIVVASHAAE
jgi:MFS family permease